MMNVGSSNGNPGNFEYFITKYGDPSKVITEYLDTTSILNLSRTSKAFYNNDILWKQMASRHQLDTTEKGATLRDIIQKYLKTPLLVEAVTIEQNEKQLDTKKYKISLYPEIKVAEIVNNIF